MQSPNSLLIRIGKDRIAKKYQEKGRYIDTKLYIKLKSKRKCDMCGKEPIIPEIHHIIPIRKNGTNTLDNLLVLCPECHKQIEHR